MKANELMIGDCVCVTKDFTQKYHKIRALSNNEDAVLRGIYVNEYGIENNSIFSPNDTEPIPIIPEILEKNGFEANRHVYPYPYYEYTNEEDNLKVGFAFPQGNRTSYKEPWVYIDSERVFVEHLPCMFVHQFQQAMRLCGIEKEIEL